MPEVVDKFPTAYYEAHGHLVCPNGDKLRSDAEGLFCWIEGDRVPAKVVNGVVDLLPVEKPKAKKVEKTEDKKTEDKKGDGSKAEGSKDANG